MALVSYTITAIEKNQADATASGFQIVQGASCSMYIQPADTVVNLHDDAAGTNPSTAKTTGANGQVRVFVYPGEYRILTNGISRYVTVQSSNFTPVSPAAEVRGINSKLADIVSPGDFGGGDNVIMSVKYDDDVPSSLGIVLGQQDYEASEIGAGSVLIGGYSGINNNRMPGTAQLRTIVGGYDNQITSGPLSDGANSAGLASCILASHHSEVRNTGNHCTIFGGSLNIIDDGTYNVITGGTTNQIIGTYNGAGLQNNIIYGGARNTLDGANNSMSGSDNTLKGLGSSVVGVLNTAGSTNGCNYSFIAGNSNSVERNYSAVFGLSNTVTFGYGLTVGRNNESSSDYQANSGRSSLNEIKYGRAHGFANGDTNGSAQSIEYPLTTSSTSATPVNMSSIAQGVFGPSLIEDSMITAKATVTGTDGTDAAVFEIGFSFLRSSASTTIIYNTASTKGASAGASTWAAVFGGQTDCRVAVTGEAAKNITWYADVKYVITPI